MQPNTQKRNPAGGRGFGDNSRLGGQRDSSTGADPVETIRSRLDGVQTRGDNTRAFCPACGGKSRKLSLSPSDSGGALLHCFGGCAVADVLAAIGLDVGDLFPERIRDVTPEGRRALQEAFKRNGWFAALGVLAREATVLEVAAAMIGRAEPLSAEDVDRVHLASQRIRDVKAVLA